MDLNQLLFHHQVALIHHARGVPSDAARSLAGHYARRIGQVRQKLGLAPWLLAGDAKPLGASPQVFG